MTEMRSRQTQHVAGMIDSEMSLGGELTGGACGFDRNRHRQLRPGRIVVTVRNRDGQHPHGRAQRSQEATERSVNHVLHLIRPQSGSQANSSTCRGIREYSTQARAHGDPGGSRDYQDMRWQCSALLADSTCNVAWCRL